MTSTLSPITLEERFAWSEGFETFVRSWRPPAAARGVLVIVHGFNSHSGHYLTVGQKFAEFGLAVYALDLRGRGKSDGEPFYIEKLSDYTHDIEQLVALAKRREPGLPVFLLGHSAGGVLSCTYALDHQQELAGLICESFAYQVPAPDFALAVLKGLSHLAPHTHVLRLKIEDFSRDPAIMQTLLADPLIAGEVQPTLTVAEMVRADERLKREFAHITLPVLILHGTTDKVTRPEGSQYFYDHAGSSDKTLKLYEGHAHDLLNDLDRDLVLDDIKGWIEHRL